MTAPSVFVLDDGAGLRLEVTDRGAAWMSCRVPLADGSRREVLLGHAAAAEYGHQPGYMGCVVGRYANRIAQARFTLEGRVVQLHANEGPHMLHGGPSGFSRRDWRCTLHTLRELRLTLHSPCGDQGFPGNVDAEVRYALEGAGQIAIAFEATTDAPCPVSLSHHAYFNLDGAAGSPGPIDGHRVRLGAGRYVPVDASLIPTGPLAPVDGSLFDLRQEQRLGARRFDHCFVLDGTSATEPAADITSADGALRMALHTDYPGLQFYTGQHLALARDRHGAAFAPCSGFALEPQYLPDSPNHPEWPCPGGLLLPGQRLQRHMRLRFDAPELR